MAVAFRRNPWVALAAVPLTYNAMLSLGAINYLIGMPLVFLAVAGARRWIDRGGALPGVLLAVFLLFCFFTHLFIGAMASGFCGLLLLVHMRRRIDVLRLLAVVPAVLAVVLFRLADAR